MVPKISLINKLKTDIYCKAKHNITITIMKNDLHRAQISQSIMRIYQNTVVKIKTIEAQTVV